MSRLYPKQHKWLMDRGWIGVWEDRWYKHPRHGSKSKHWFTMETAIYDQIAHEVAD